MDEFSEHTFVLPDSEWDRAHNMAVLAGLSLDAVIRQALSVFSASEGDQEIETQVRLVIAGDAAIQATAAYWLRRAQDLENGISRTRDRPGVEPGHVARQAERDRRLKAEALACRSHAWLLTEGQKNDPDLTTAPMPDDPPPAWTRVVLGGWKGIRIGPPSPPLQGELPIDYGTDHPESGY